MFSPAVRRKPHVGPHRDRNLEGTPGQGSPSTPLAENQRSSSSLASPVPNRPSTGTPAPWASRLSVLARIPPAKKSVRGNEADQLDPVYVEEFPQIVRDAQAEFLQKTAPDDEGLSGGLDRGTSIAWMICGDQLFLWSVFSSSVSKKCVTLKIPSFIASGGIDTNSWSSNSWMISVIKWDGIDKANDSVGVVICNQKTEAVIYWPDVYSINVNTPVIDLPKPTKNLHSQISLTASGILAEPSAFSSLIASPIPGSPFECIALACRSNGELWQFRCTLSGIHREKVGQVFPARSNVSKTSDHTFMTMGYARSLIWCFNEFKASEESKRQFFLLTNHEIQCWEVQFTRNLNVSRLWAHEIVGTDGDLGIKKDLAGQKHIWLLDLQVDSRGKELTVLVATFCKDRVSSSSYTQYSLLTMLCKTECAPERALEKKAPIQVIIPKARVEDVTFLFSMRLRVGGKPSGSTIVLSPDGTATVTHYWRGATRLYQFDLPYDAGNVLDASVLPSADDNEDGGWVVLTAKAGIWAIPEKAVLFGGVEPPERSLSRKGSLKEGAAEEEKRSLAFGANIAPRRVSSEAWDAGNRQRAAFSTGTQRTPQDEESEALLGRLFHDFLLNGLVDGSFEKLKNCGSFEKDGETNVFARASKSIIDTLAKHWTTTRGPEIGAMAVVSTQLLDKEKKHKKYLQFLALSKCHEELRASQRHSLQAIMEHGEKLAGMIELRELQNHRTHNQSGREDLSYSSPPKDMAGPLWDLIQIVGEKSRRNTVLLMDRDNVEVFYSKVSEVEELYRCLYNNLQYIVRGDQPLLIQIQRACEISEGSTMLIRAAMNYKNVHHTWYPSPEGLTPWYCQPVVRSGLWALASFLLQLIKDATGIDLSMRLELYSHLEMLTDVLLETYSGAITAQIERGEEHKLLVEEYRERRDVLFDALYQQVKGFVEVRCQDFDKSTEDAVELKAKCLRELSESLLSIARRHEGYQTLWNICYDLNDAGLLRTLMRESMGPRGGFSYFVFKQLYEMWQHSKLLRLGEEFQDELSIFLKQHKELLWLHELYLNSFASASESLHALALSQDASALATDEGSESECSGSEPQSLADRKRLLNLSKIAAVAGGEAGFEIKVRRIEADLYILKLQEEIVKLCPGYEQHQANKLLTPEKLITLCLNSKNRDLCLRAFDVFAWTSSSFRKKTKILLEECWKNAANQDDWGNLQQAFMAEGWNEEETLEYLKETILFKASKRCYGADAEIFDGGFEEVLLLHKDGESPIVNDFSVSSVEAILMQHKDFPDAGKLMKTSIMMGKYGTDFVIENGSFMEVTNV
ncbi:nuclear pore complex protein NUP133 [Aristolochia californica]|uniref:nuclear pore complex protein NUP133 n=1 Tax=Aristolochia californica TaxID=171875 RepID=UPI0035E22A99